MEKLLLQLTGPKLLGLFLSIAAKKITQNKWMLSEPTYIQKSGKQFTLNSHRASES